jgi:hypothetical protein
MKYSGEAWIQKRKRGLAAFLLFDGILLLGGPFALIMQIAGYFVLRDSTQTFSEYFQSSMTWFTFFGHATLFGLVIGLINWFGNERAFRSGPADVQTSTEGKDNFDA